MQRIDRYGLVTLVFLLVTFVAVVVWGEGQSESFEQLFRHGAAPPSVAAAAPHGANPAATTGARPTARTDQRAGTRADRMRRVSGTQPTLVAPTIEAPVLSDTRRSDARSDAQSGARSGAAPEAPVRLTSARLLERPIGSGGSGGPRGSRAERDAVEPERSARLLERPAQTAGRTYVVQAGDTVSEISERELGTYKRWREIVAANPGLDPARLKVGQKLALPDGVVAARATAEPATTDRSTGRPTNTGGTGRVADATPADRTPTGERAGAGSTYVVQAGDTLTGIAARELGDDERWREIQALNDGLDPRRLAVGMRLELPGGASSAPRADLRVAAADQPAPRSSRVQ